MASSDKVNLILLFHKTSFCYLVCYLYSRRDSLNFYVRTYKFLSFIARHFVLRPLAFLYGYNLLETLVTFYNHWCSCIFFQMRASCEWWKMEEWVVLALLTKIVPKGFIFPKLRTLYYILEKLQQLWKAYTLDDEMWNKMFMKWMSFLCGFSVSISLHFILIHQH